MKLGEIVYAPAALDRPIRLIGEIFGQDAGRRYFWLDGLSMDDAVLIPVSDVDLVQSHGDLVDFAGLYADEFDRLADESEGALEEGDSATLIARTCMAMREHGLTAGSARAKMIELGRLLIEMDCCESMAQQNRA
jgi:hypothetical protein